MPSTLLLMSKKQPRRDYEIKKIVEMKSIKPDLSKKRLKNISLSYQCIQIILGGLLGDSSLKLQKGYKNARLQIRHSITQKEYLLWKADKLKEIANASTCIQIQKADGFSKNEKIAFMSKALPELSEIHKVVCKNNLLRIERHWLNHFDELALLVWWLDDGSIIANGKKGVFCSDAFDYPSHKILRRYLIVVWDITPTIGNLYRQKNDKSNKAVLVEEKKDLLARQEDRVYTKSVYHRLYLNNQELRKLFHLIMPLLKTASMVKKFALRYNDSEHQQRWISKMKAEMPTFHKEIDDLYNQDS